MRGFVHLFPLWLVGALLCVPISFAQVYSSNAIAYINVSLVPGFNLISNPLRDNPGYTVASLAKAIQGNVPDGFSVYLLHPDGYHSAAYDASTGSFEPADVAAEPLSPGRGFFVFNPARNNLAITFVGQVLLGTLTNDLPSGFSIVASMVPQAGTPEVLRFPTEPGDIVYRFNPLTQTYIVSIFDDLDRVWLPNVPRIDTAEAFIVYKSRPAVWTRTFLPPQDPGAGQ